MSNDSSSASSGEREGTAAAKSADYRRLPWGPAAGIIVTLLAFVVAQLLAGGLFLLVLSLTGWHYQHITNWLNGVIGQFLLVLVSESLAVGVVWLFLHRRKAGWRQVGFARSPQWRDIGVALLGFVIYFALLLVAASIARAFLHVDLDQKQDIGFNHVAGGAEKIMTFVSLVLLPPLVEETLFRGFLFGGLRKKLSFGWATLVASLLFAGPHLLESASGPLWIAGIDTLVLSFVLCYLRERTGALWAGILVHTMKNGLAFLYLYIFVSK